MNWTRHILTLLVIGYLPCVVLAEDPHAAVLKPYSENPSYWQYKGVPFCCWVVVTMTVCFSCRISRSTSMRSRTRVATTSAIR